MIRPDALIPDALIAPAFAAFAYDRLDASTALQPRDPTEHNMERLNRKGRGCSTGRRSRAATRGDPRRPG